MTDLTGVLTSTGQPLKPGLQHNEAAQVEIQRRWVERQRAHDEALNAAFAVSTAEQAIETLRIRLSNAERRQQSWTTAAAAMPETMGATDPAGSKVDQLLQDIAQAERYLANATRTHAEASARYLAAHNAAATFQREVYADYRDPIEVDAP